MRRALSPRGEIDAAEAFALHEGERQRRPSANNSTAAELAQERVDDNGKQRRGLRRIVMVWNAEKIGLLALFVGALTVGYVTSTWMWQLDMGGALPQPLAVPERASDTEVGGCAHWRRSLAQTAAPHTLRHHRPRISLRRLARAPAGVR